MLLQLIITRYRLIKSAARTSIDPSYLLLPRPISEVYFSIGLNASLGTLLLAGFLCFLYTTQLNTTMSLAHIVTTLAMLQGW